MTTMTSLTRRWTAAMLGVAALSAALAPGLALAQDAPVPDKGDTAWMLVSTLLVVLMTVPGLALFYGGLVRAKNILSVLMQVMVGFSLIVVLWCIYGYSLALTEGNAFIGGLDRLFLSGTFDPATGSFATAATFTDGVVLTELLFVAFQATFAGITCCLIIGAFAERMRFSAVLIFMVIWFTICYIPIAHMVWGPGGLLLEEGALDFAGGTVVHINAGVAGLVGAYMVGKRVGLGREPMPPHNLALTMVGASLLWVGWFGFNAGSALEANDSAVLAFLNTLLATAGAVVAWSAAEWILKKHASMLGAASGAIAGLVAITPAAGNVGPMGALIIGLVAGVVCLWGVTGLKRLLKADDSLDAFGIHGVGGIVGALLTGVFYPASMGGPGGVDATVGGQVPIQAGSVVLTIVWSAVAAFIAFKIADLVVGLRVPEESEREGLDTTEHNERAYTS